MGKISKIKSREILDSRGNPTIEVDVTLESGVSASACVPSGASTGAREALELRDQDPKRFLGKGVLKACENIDKIIAPKIIGFVAREQESLDNFLCELDGDEFKKNLGANALLGVSLATDGAQAKDEKKPLYHYLGELFSNKDFLLPAPLMNIINGGEHASNNLDIQEFMILPRLDRPFKENLRAGVEIFHYLKKNLSKKSYSTNVGDEGGFAPNLSSHEEALDLIMSSIESAGYRPGEEVMISLDAAASEFFKEGSYHMEAKSFSSDEMIDYYEGLTKKYPIYSIEDGLDEADYTGWTNLTKKLREKSLLVGDDLFVTNPKIFKEGIEKKWANSILIKLNQIGTLSETFDAIAMAKEHEHKVIISHRSGETADHFIADLAVATGAGHIKTGSASRSDRLEKYNQLLRIEESLGEKALYNRV